MIQSATKKFALFMGQKVQNLKSHPVYNFPIYECDHKTFSLRELQIKAKHKVEKNVD